MKSIVITGGSGKLGRVCVKHFLDAGYRVRVIDKVAAPNLGCGVIRADLADFGQTLDAIAGGDAQAHGVDAVVHLAAIPAPRLFPDSTTFQNNIVSDFNVFNACQQLGINDVVWASSETVLGLPFDVPPAYVPVDEGCEPRPESAYSLAKHLSEKMAEQFCRRNPAMKIVGLRFSNVMDVPDYDRFESFQDDARKRKWNLWGYIDARDASAAIRLAVEHKPRGPDVFIIANADTVMHRTNDDLLGELFPNVERRGKIGEHDTLLAIAKAKKVLGYEPKFGWRK